MIRAVIADDEPRNIKLIVGMINDHCPGIQVVGTTDDLSELPSLVQELKPALLLLDISFPAGNVFTVLERLTYTNFQVIFITAHNTYAAEAFRQQAIDYILKPVTKESLVSAIKRAEAQINIDATTDISNLVREMKAGFTQSKKIPLPSAEGILFVKEQDIIRCEASGRYTHIHLLSKKKLTVSKTLKDIESLLSPGSFFRVHHSHIINLEMIKIYHRGNGGMAELTDGSFVDVASSRKEELLEILLNKSTS